MGLADLAAASAVRLCRFVMSLVLGRYNGGRGSSGSNVLTDALCGRSGFGLTILTAGWRVGCIAWSTLPLSERFFDSKSSTKVFVAGIGVSSLRSIAADVRRRRVVGGGFPRTITGGGAGTAVNLAAAFVAAICDGEGCMVFPPFDSPAPYPSETARLNGPPLAISACFSTVVGVSKYLAALAACSPVPCCASPALVAATNAPLFPL